MPRVMIVLDDDQLEQLEMMAGLGTPMDEMAVMLGMHERTLEKLLKRDPRAKAAVKRGRFKANSVVAQTAWNMARSGLEPGMTQFWLKCRAGWRDPNLAANQAILDQNNKPKEKAPTLVIDLSGAHVEPKE